MILPADGVPLPFGARWVGGAMAACPDGIPWQRVVNGRGRISLRKEGAIRQKMLLEQEGVSFGPEGRIDFDRFGWNGPDVGWREKRGLKKPPPLAPPFQAKLKY